MPEIDRRFVLSAMLAATAPVPASANGPARPSASDRGIGDSDRYETRADLRTHTDRVTRMTAPVRIAGQTVAQFLVDTGADRTTISAELAQALGFPLDDPIRLHGVAGFVETPTVRLPLLEVGDRRFTNVPAPVLPEADLGAQGLLGIDCLRDQRLMLDFKRSRLVIQGGRRIRVNADEIVVRARPRFGQMTLVDAWLEGEPIVVIIDSGAESSIANSAFRERVTRLRRKAAQAGDVEVLSVTGQSTRGSWAVVPRLRLASFTLRNLPVVYADLHTFERWGVQDEPAMLLGVDVLRQFETVWIDFIRKEVRFRLPPSALVEPLLGAG